MVEEEIELGQATIVYEDPEEGVIRKTVPNEHIAYFQDHWIIKMDDDESDADLVRRIPAQRVYYVERSVEEFEEEVATRLDQIQSFVEELQTRIPIGGLSRASEASTLLGTSDESEEEAERIEIDLTDDDDENERGDEEDGDTHDEASG